MFRSLFRSLLCKNGGCCLWVFLRRRQPFYEDDDDEMICDPGMNIAMSHWCGASLPDEAPTWYECTLGEVYEHKSTISDGSDVTAQIYEDAVANTEKLVAEGRSTSRLLACRDLCTIYGRVTPTVREHLGEIYHRLCLDEDLLVRRMALSMFTDIAEEADVTFYASHLVPILETFLEDKIGLRLEATKLLIALFKSKKLSDDVNWHLLPVFYKYAVDPYWQVRFLIASSINDVHKSVNTRSLKSSFIPLISKFLKDADTRVRSAAVRQFQDV